MKKIGLVLVLFSFLHTVSFPQNENWDNIISGGKKITALAEYENYIWVGTDIGLIKLNKTDCSIIIFDKISGLPGNFITAMAIDNNGNVWFGLSNDIGLGYGLVNFDGIGFTIYNTSNSGLSGNYVSALCFDQEDNLWIGCINENTSLVKYDGVNWITFNSNNSLLPFNKVIKSIAVDSTNLWVGTQGGLVSFDGINWELYSGMPSIIVNSVYVDNNNNKWIGFFNGVVKYNDSTWTVFSGTDSTTPLYYNAVNCVTVDENNVLWVGTFKGLVKYDFINWHIYTPANSDLPTNEISVVITDAENNKWFGSFDYHNNGGLTKYDGQNWQNYKTWKGDLHSNYINFIKNNNDTICIGTHVDLTSVTNNIWESFSWQDSLNDPNNSYNFVSSTKDNNGNFWYALRGSWPIGNDPISGILKYDGQNWTKFDPTNSNLPVCIINKIEYSTDDNLLWLATSIGAVKYDGNNWTLLDTLQNIIPYPYILTTMIIDKDVKWFGSSYYGLISYDNNSWKLYNTSNSDLPNDQITDLYQDLNNNIWISTQNGLAKFDKNIWTVYNTSNSGLPDNWITSCIVDHHNVCLIGTFNDGFVEFDGENWEIYTLNNSPLLSNNICDLEEDANGNIWIGLHDAGITIYNRNGISSTDHYEKNSSSISYRLLQNFPNPFNPSTKITWQSPVSGWQTLKVYDILGNEVATLVDEYRNAGSYDVEFRIDNVKLSSGVYFYQLRAGDYVETKKMILMK
jgi:ligand-binding sensor domain-containing protein